ncbi:hypothetical protein PC129_g12685 [Phytophthora cactorum]|uniref:Uncharacterized protein n=1 Tax=Phytophthora cactorum TaxID=29920 RepID=A0A8T1HX75_9STRA|nr:hypothetical protein Pcac1_g16686 [Phytophthora cactorum]KAG2895034.1 hypothetical protein PC114_g15642 [Phytophthora cactorum]KAG2928973.1 hypothetical protein PC117_g14151 [Phytophthora cactorum]KAG3017939.1 hypothetical protein PC120_g10734 [Phytophthora cactorum]KAG3152226.1 hypothetical protein C6341_g16334 [Phytophthora cactorum]
MVSAGSDPEVGSPPPEASASEAHVPAYTVPRVVAPAIQQRYFASCAAFYEY